MANFLDKAFNLAGLFRGLLGGILLSLILTFVLVLFHLTGSGSIFIMVFLVLPLAGAILGIKEKSANQNGKALKNWLKFTRIIFFLSLFTGKIVSSDAVIPEKITVRRFLIWLIIFVALIVVFIQFPAARSLYQKYSY
jgi:heme A synthase